MKPNHSFEVQVWVVDVLDVLDAAREVVLVGSWQPNHPGVLHVEDEVVVEEDWADDVVTVGAGAGVATPLVIVVVVVVVNSSLQPNQPGEIHVVVVMVWVVVTGTVVGSSKHPHQPGVLHVSVLVRVVDG